MTTNHCNRKAAALAAALGTTAALFASTAPGATTWKAAISGQQRVQTLPIEWYAKEVAAKTGGELKIVVSYGHKTTESLEILKSGRAEAASVCASSYIGKAWLPTVLELPMFAPEDITALGRVQMALGSQPAVQAELRSWNVKMLVPSPLPQFQLMGTRRIAKVEDFKGIKVRASPEMGKILQEYGAIIHPIPVTETLDALKSGAIDVAAMPYPNSFKQYKIHEGASYVMDKISLGAPFCFLGVSQKAWDALPAKVRETMLGLREPTLAQFEAAYARESADDVAAFKQKGMEFLPFSTTDRTRLVAKAIKIWQGWVDEREKQGLKGREVFEFTQAKIREYTRK